MAAVVLAAPLTFGQTQPAQAVDGSLMMSTYVPIVPCRLVDTRPKTKEDQARAVGPRIAPIHAQESYTFQVTGKNGNWMPPMTNIPA